MRSKTRTVIIYKHPTLGTTPPYLQLAQRHLEKERPFPVYEQGSHAHTFSVPVDLVSMTIGPELAAEIDAVELTYSAPR